jgi:hypothetical protein
MILDKGKQNETMNFLTSFESGSNLKEASAVHKLCVSLHGVGPLAEQVGI